MFDPTNMLNHKRKLYKEAKEYSRSIEHMNSERSTSNMKVKVYASPQQPKNKAKTSAQQVKKAIQRNLMSGVVRISNFNSKKYAL